MGSTQGLRRPRRCPAQRGVNGAVCCLCDRPGGRRSASHAGPDSTEARTSPHPTHTHPEHHRGGAFLPASRRTPARGLRAARGRARGRGSPGRQEMGERHKKRLGALPRVCVSVCVRAPSRVTLDLYRPARFLRGKEAASLKIAAAAGRRRGAAAAAAARGRQPGGAVPTQPLPAQALGT